MATVHTTSYSVFCLEIAQFTLRTKRFGIFSIYLNLGMFHYLKKLTDNAHNSLQNKLLTLFSPPFFLFHTDCHFDFLHHTHPNLFLLVCHILLVYWETVNGIDPLCLFIVVYDSNQLIEFQNFKEKEIKHNR